MNKILTLALGTALALPAWSAPRTLSLLPPTIDGLVCPITVKKALGKVEGVRRTEVDFGKRQAVG